MANAGPQSQPVLGVEYGSFEQQQELIELQVAPDSDTDAWQATLAT
jgi:hypothetical protein